MDAPKTPLPDHIVKAALDIWEQADRQNLIPISGRSMLPLIQNGDVVLVAHGKSGVRRGDIIVFMQNNQMVAHRVLRAGTGGSSATFLAKGDNNPYFDPPVTVDRIVGRVLKIERNGKWVAVDTPLWRALGWLIAVGMLTWLKFYALGRGVKQKIWGRQSNRLVDALRRGGLALAAFPLKMLQKVGYRWRE